MEWRRARVLAGVAAVFLVLVGALVAASGSRVARTLGSAAGLGPDCTVAVPGAEDVELSSAEAQAAARGAALAVKRGWSSTRAATEVTTAVAGAGSDLDAADAAATADALTGRTRAALSCRAPASPSPEPDSLSPRGLTARAEAVRADVLASFGRLPLGGYAPGGVRSGHMAGSAHYAGRAIDVFFRPPSPAQKQRGWAVAQYLVANAERLQIRTVIYDGRIWSAWRGDQGWRDYQVDTTGRSRAVARVLEHRDHVHVDVAD